MLQSVAASLSVIVLSVPQSDLSHYCTLSVSDCFMGLFECQVCCQALVHHKNILSAMC